MTEESVSTLSDPAEAVRMLLVLHEVLTLQLPVKNNTEKAIAAIFACRLMDLLYAVGGNIDRFTERLRYLGKISECKGAPSWRRLSHIEDQIQDHLDGIDVVELG